MKVLTLSGYFRLPDDADAGDVEAAVGALARYWLGPDPEKIDATLPAEIPKRPDGKQSDEMWVKFMETVFKGGRIFFQAGVGDVDVQNPPEMIG